MSIYELSFLLKYTGEQNITLVSVFIGMSSAAIVAAYVAGHRLSWTLTSGIIFLYSIPALSMARVRYNLGEQMVLLHRDLADLVARESITMHSVATSSATYSFGNEIALAFYLAIWLAVVFFVLYAKSRPSKPA